MFIFIFISCTSTAPKAAEDSKENVIAADELAMEKKIAELESQKEFKIKLAKEATKQNVKPVTSDRKLPNPAEYRIVNSRSISHLLYGLIPKPGAKLKESEAHLYYSSFYYTKEGNQIKYVVGNPGKGQKPYLKDIIYYDKNNRPYARESYTRSGRHSYTRYVKYEGDKTIMTYRFYRSNGEVKHLKYLNGYQPEK
ncbi:MAG: hypothetical protein NE327_13670 [Lentisphaeraceae bacterium]|nr:hypothetical protein [Lentisphaeraceae bacterium]